METVTIQVPEDAQSPPSPSPSSLSPTRLTASRDLQSGCSLAYKTTSYISYVPEVFKPKEDIVEPLKFIKPGK